ncbi:TetR/AcrR family transcriptional regulator [Nocardia sp. NPDC046763]|uniref:TetR/AcrR family transcriptional regulator n=1 Tax=Nocardia sp. NPDC046763 TaxID=3155256 RepID=UPI0033D748DD
MTGGEVRRRPGGRSARVREAVLEAALNVLADKGVGEFAVSDVVAASGVHETTIYRRWGSRDELIIDTLLSYSEQRIPVPDTGAIRTDLYELLDAVAAYLGTPHGRALNQALSFGGGEPRWVRVREAFWTTRLELTRPIVERGIDRGELPAGTDPRLLLETLIAPLQFRTLVTRKPIDPQLCVRLVDLLLDGAISGPRP